MAGLNGWLSQKYAIKQQDADANTRLSGAQANETNLRAGTLQPLANASIAATGAGIGETRARTGFYGAQTAGINDGLSPANDVGLQAAYRALQNFNGQTPATQPANAGTGGPAAQPNGATRSYAPNGSEIIHLASPTPDITAGGVGGPTAWSGRSILDRGPQSYFPDPRIPGATSNAYADGATSVQGGEHMGRYAEGTPAVPAIRAPGQTTSNGTWTPPNANPPSGQNQDLRAKMGYGSPPVKAFAKGSSKVKGKGRPARAPLAMPMMMPPGAAPGMPNGPMAGASPMPGGAPPGAPGLAGMLNAAIGANRVPGQPQPAGVARDTVPSMLTPGEAVVNKEGVQHLPGGRGAVAKANSKGLMDRKKAQMKMGMGKPMGGKPPGKGSNHVAVHIKMA